MADNAAHRMGEATPSEAAQAIAAARDRIVQFARSCTGEQWAAAPLTDGGDPRPVGVIVDHVGHAYEYLGDFIAAIVRGDAPHIDNEAIDLSTPDTPRPRWRRRGQRGRPPAAKRRRPGGAGAIAEQRAARHDAGPSASAGGDLRPPRRRPPGPTRRGALRAGPEATRDIDAAQSPGREKRFVGVGQANQRRGPADRRAAPRWFVDRPSQSMLPGGTIHSHGCPVAAAMQSKPAS